MCLALPGKVLEIIGENAMTRRGRIAFAGIEKEASMAFLPDAAVGNYVLVHAGFAIAILDEESAQRSLDYLDTIAEIEPEAFES